jgi:hypothetical protein
MLGALGAIHAGNWEGDSFDAKRGHAYVLPQIAAKTVFTLAAKLMTMITWQFPGNQYNLCRSIQ